MLKKMKYLLFAISCFSLTNCGPKPPDVFVFESLDQKLTTDPVTNHLMLTPSPTCMTKINEVSCGHGVAIVSGKEIFIGEVAPNLFNGKRWSEVKLESVYVPAKESYAPLATYIIDSCKKMGCDNAVDAFKIKLNSLNGISGALGSP